MRYKQFIAEDLTDGVAADSKSLVLSYDSVVLEPKFLRTAQGNRIPLRPDQKILEVGVTPIDVSFVVSTEDITTRQALLLRVDDLRAIAIEAMKESYHFIPESATEFDYSLIFEEKE